MRSREHSSSLAGAEPDSAVGVQAESIHFLDLTAQFRAIRGQVNQAISNVLETQQFILGPEVEAFESEIAKWNHSRHAIACASGSDALLLALMALGVRPGDEVITTPFTFVAAVGCIARLGAVPVLVDIDRQTFNLDPSQLERAVTARTRAIIPVHLFGCPADLDPILAIAQRKSIPVIEDAAQAIGAQYDGARVGNFGIAGCFSFYPTKNLGCAGDGGLITTHDDSFAAKLKSLRNHGGLSRYRYDVIGMNSRLDALQAAILRVKLPYLDAWTEGRRRNAARYRDLFSRSDASGIVLPDEPPRCYHIYNQFTIRSRQRDALRAFLTTRRIPSEVYYPAPLHLEPAFSYLGYKTGDFPESEAACCEVMSLPIYPELPEEHLSAVVEGISAFHR